MKLTWLAEALRSADLDVVEHPGWKTHAAGQTWTPQFGVVHATAAPRGQADSVQVGVVRNGRTGLPGPIANCVVTRDGCWHVVAAGRCNTTLPGTAGPFKGQGNTDALGVEGCNDNRGEPWPDVQYRSYVRGWAAICHQLGWSADRLAGHREHTPGHKTDPTFNMNQFRADVAAVLAGEDDDVQLTDKIKLNTSGAVKYSNPETTVAGVLASTNYYVLQARNQLTAELRQAALRDAAILAAVQGAGSTEILARVDQLAQQLATLPADIADALEDADQLERLIREGMSTEARLALAARLAR